VVITNKINPPVLVQTLHIPNFLLTLSNQSVGGNKKGKITVRSVNEIVGVDI
jgi:hypothetical protein